MLKLPYYATVIIPMLSRMGRIENVTRRTTKKIEITTVKIRLVSGHHTSATIREGRIAGFNLGLFEVKIGRFISFTEIEYLGEFIDEASAAY